MSSFKKVDGLGGKVISSADLERLCRSVAVPPQLAELMSTVPLIGVRFSLSEEADRSGLGAEIQWMNPDQMLSEAAEAYPGKVAIGLGYFPVGVCLEGTGDPYFYRQTDGTIVRIPHDAASESSLDEGGVETVAESVDALVRVAELESP